VALLRTDVGVVMPKQNTALEEILEENLHTLMHDDLAFWEKGLNDYTQHEKRFKPERRLRNLYASLVNHLPGMSRRPNRRREV